MKYESLMVRAYGALLVTASSHSSSSRLSGAHLQEIKARIAHFVHERLAGHISISHPICVENAYPIHHNYPRHQKKEMTSYVYPS